MSLQVQDTSSDGLPAYGSPNPGFAIFAGQTVFVSLMTKSKYFTIDNGPKLTFKKYYPKSHYGKDVIRYGPAIQNFKSYENHTFNFVF